MPERLDLRHQDWALLSLSWRGADPWMRVRIDGSSHDVPLIGTTLQYEATELRVCLGHSRVGGSRSECVEPPVVGERHCQSCRIRNAGFAASLHHAHTKQRTELSADALEHLDQTNVLYLAAFRDGSVKVGTSTAARLPTRLTEQGAWRARLVAEADDGFVVREIEDHVTEFVGVPQSVSIRRKLDGIVSPVSDSDLDVSLDTRASRVSALVERLADDRLRPIDETWEHPNASNPTWRSVHRYPFRLDTGPHHLEVVDAVGRVGAMRRPGHGDDIFAADLGELFGVFVAPGAFESGEIAIQDSLF